MNEGVNKSTILAVATMGSFLTPFMGASINMALPSMGKERTMSAIMLGCHGFSAGGSRRPCSFR